MSDMSVCEHKAVLRKRGEFVDAIRSATQPIFEAYFGKTNSGTYAIALAEQALSKHRESVDAAARSELDGLLVRLAELIESNKEIA